MTEEEIRGLYLLVLVSFAIWLTVAEDGTAGWGFVLGWWACRVVEESRQRGKKR